MAPNPVQNKAKSFEPLGKRELEILSLMAQDLSDRVIAERLVVAYTTVKWYNRQIFNKLGVNNRHEAIETARALNLLSTQEPVVMPHHNLPSQITPFIGRETELHDLFHKIRDQGTRLVTLLAPGGMGKTRLGLAIAEKLLPSFPDGVTFVSLAPLKSSSDIVPTIASQSGYLFQRNNRTSAQQLIDFFSNRKALLILDNFEHLLDGASFVVELLQAAPELCVLVTSREKLNLSGEVVYSLEGLDYPSALDEHVHMYSAVQLFIQCAQRTRPTFNPDDKFADIIRICQLVQGFPLAIELAAAWVEVLPPVEIAIEITASLDFLSSSLRDLPERQRSMRAVFESTWRRLTEEERTAFMKLSVFRGGCTRRAAQTVAGVGLRTLTILADKALVSWSTETERYTIHELLRQYAADALEQAQEGEAVRNAHSLYYGTAMAERESHLKDKRQLEALKDISTDLDNVIAGLLWALQRGDDVAGLAYIKTLGLFYHIRSRYQEAADLLDECVSIIESREKPADSRLLGWVLAWQGHHHNLQWHYETGVIALERSLAIARDLNDRLLEAFCLRYGLAKTDEAATKLTQEALSICRDLNDQYMIALCLHTLAFLFAKTHHQSNAYLQMTTEACMIRKQIGDFSGLANSLNNLADYHQRVGNWDEAERTILECLALHRQLSSAHGIAMGLRNHTAQLLFRHDFVNAENNLREGLALVRETGHRNNVIAILYQASLLHLLQGHYDEARAMAEESLSEGLQLVAANQFEALYPRIALGCALCGLRQYEIALPHLYAGLPHAEGAPADNVSRRYVLTCIAYCYLHSGDPEYALELISVVIHSPLSPSWWGTEEPLAIRLLDELKTTLSHQTYSTAWEQGQRADFDTTLEELIARIPTQN